MNRATTELKSNAEDLTHPTDYTSEMLQLYSQDLIPRKDPQLLDVGPVCEENIRFFAGRVKRHYVCDMFIRLNRIRQNQLPSETLWNHLDYPYQSFHGIHLWDLIDRLDDKAARRLIERCHFMLKPKSMILAVTFEEHLPPSFIYSFVIREKFRIAFRPQRHLELPRYFRSNRELTALMGRFRLVRSFLYRNGVREFLFQRG